MLRNLVKMFAVIALCLVLLLIAAMPAEASDQAGSSHFIAISAGYGHNLALKNDGTVWACGSNTWGVCGKPWVIGDDLSVKYGSVLNWSQVEGISGVKAISSGSSVSVALKDDGTVWTWGGIIMLGDGSGTPASANETAHPVPVQVPGLENVKAISAQGSGYGEYVLVLKDDGTVWGWGDNRYCVLGPDYPAERVNTPVIIKGLSGITKIYTSFGNPLAIKDDGTVWTWGYRAIVDANTVLLPTQIAGISDAVDVAVTSDYINMLKPDGTVWSVTGKTRYGLSDSSSYPVQVQSVKDITSISALRTHTLALSKDGSVWAWGVNTHGQIGNGNVAGEMSMVQVPPYKVPISNIVAVSAGDVYSLALDEDGSVWAWGRDDVGQLGNGQYGKNLTVSNPVKVYDGVTGDSNPNMNITNGDTVTDPATSPSINPGANATTTTPSPVPGFDLATIGMLVGLMLTYSLVCRIAGKE